MKLVFSELELLAENKFYFGPCNEGKKLLKKFNADYPKGVKFSKEELEAFITRHKLNKQYIGVLLHALLKMFVSKASADKYDDAFFWKYTSKEVQLAKFYQLMKNSKLAK